VPPATERLYRFNHLLRDRFDAAADGGAVNLAGEIDLTHFRLEELGTHDIPLGGDVGPLSAIRGEGVGSTIAPEDLPRGLLGDLVELFNDRFGAELTDADAIRPLLHVADKVVEQNPHLRDEAQSNDLEDFEAGKEGAIVNALLAVQGINDTVIKKSLDDDEVLHRLSSLVMRSLYERFNADAY
jgi:type I restriction enzyme R subunit